MTMSKRMTIREVGDSSVIERREPFTTNGSLKGGPVTGYFNTGRMPEPQAQAFRDANREGHITYVVTSYETPIAWFDTTVGWVMPETKYSVTTTKQQNYVRLALRGLLNPPVEEPKVYCAYCDESIVQDANGVWVDATDGDCCWGDAENNNENEPHTPLRKAS